MKWIGRTMEIRDLPDLSESALAENRIHTRVSLGTGQIS